MTRVIFMGTPEFAVPSLNALIAAPRYEVVGVVTQPDRVAGRGNKLTPPPVKVAALAANLKVLQPEKLRLPGVFEQLEALAPDLIVVAAYGQILRQNVLDLPLQGCINVHASLLPRWRGAAPIQAAVRAGDPETGITIMMMEAGLDTGPMLSKRSLIIHHSETAGEIHDKLALIGGPLLIETLDRYLIGEITPQPQDESLHTYAPMIKKEDGWIDWSQSAGLIERQVRAYDPWPGTFTMYQGATLKIIGGDALEIAANGDPGRVIRMARGIAVATGAGVFQLSKIQPPGKPPIAVDAFLNGYPEFLGSRLGDLGNL
jgi:methionyl-tRNA formyltransferase